MTGDGAGPIRQLNAEEIESIKDEITPITEIRFRPLGKLISDECPMVKPARKHAANEDCRRW